MKLQHLVMWPWSLVKPCSPLWSSSATGTEPASGHRKPGVPLPLLAGDGDMGVPSPPAQWGSPQAIIMLSPDVLLCLAGLHP